MGRGIVETLEVFRAQTLVGNAPTIFNKEFPLGEGWRKLMLRINLVLTNTTGTTALSEGELRIIKSIRLRTDKNEMICNSIPGRFLYKIAQTKEGTAPAKDAISATAGTFRVWLPIWFVDPLMLKPEDTIFNTGRHNSLQLEVTMGGVADLLGVVGDSAVTMTADCYVERVKGKLDPAVAPSFYPEYGVVAAPVDPSAAPTEISPERAANLAYKRFYLATTTASTAGLPYSGTANDAVFSDVTVEDDTGFPLNTILADALQRMNKQDYQEEALVAGMRVCDFVKDKSMLSALYSGDKSRLKIKWTNGTLPATPQVTAAYEGYRPLNNQGQGGSGK